MKFKVGDKVRIAHSRASFGESTCDVESSNPDYLIITAVDSRGQYTYSAYRNDEEVNSCCYCLADKHLEPFAETHNTKQSIMKQLSIAFKKAVSADLQTQIKAGFRDEALNLTEAGKTALLEIIASSPAGADYVTLFTAAATEAVPESLK